MALEAAPNVSARGADDANMGDEVAQRDISDAESISGDEIREPRRRNSPSDPTSREIGDYVLTGHARSCRGVQLVSKGEVEPRDTREKAARNLRMVQICQSCRGITASLGPGIESMRPRFEQRGDSLVLVMHDGVTKSIFCSFDSREGSLLISQAVRR